MSDFASMPAFRPTTVTRPIRLPIPTPRGWFRGWAIVGAALAAVDLALLALAAVIL